ncbi:MAG TPA: RHS repeat-associated core domain-containing protein [Archangium sp.]|uniref:RHS repeat-associated core domain-containing protein n=1 Tax=Archangium sp. TaxID=1872627 RepID=UPI002E33BD10|nr:RHS repeat-associated core domain-containing protein [Archangium sp.]HEX5748654.1 RHS repeat-associated core domain-containing protein [Archangium sp.]
MSRAPSALVTLILVSLVSASPRTAEAGNVEPFYGAFSTQVPIELPAFHALEPNLTLTYSSGGQNGWLGVGWSVSGVSFIERASRGKGAPRYDASDMFLLDGQELVADASLGGTHSTRIQGYMRIVQDSANNRWTVYRKDGTRLSYEPVFAVSRGTFRWALKTAQDTHGNTVSYGYWCDSGADCYLDAIAYNGTTIKFYSEARPDPISYATGAGLARTNYRLKSILVSAPGPAPIRAYKLAYASSGGSGRSLLVSVQQYGRDVLIDAAGTITGGTALPPMTLGWSGASANKQLQYSGSSSTSTETYWTSVVDHPSYHGKTVSLDINGDGRDDLAMVYQDVNNRVTLAQHWISDGGKLQYAGSSSTSTETYWTSVVDSSTYRGKVFPMDVNGDGRGDLVMIYQDVNNRVTLAQHWISDGNKLQYAGSSSTSTETYWTSVVDSGTYHGKVFPMDVNGDGRGDLVMIYQDVNNRVTLTQHWISDGSKLQYAGSSSTSNETYWTSVVDSSTYRGKVLAMDVNGDGRGDLVMIYQDVNNRVTLAQHWLSDGNKLQYEGSSSTSNETYWTSVVDSGTYHGKVFTSDINGDGRSDLAMVYQDVNNRVTLSQHWISDGGRLQYAGSSSTSNETYWTSVVDSGTYRGRVLPMDVNGDGRGDLVMIYQDVNNRVTLAQHWLAAGTSPDLLTSVSNGLGGTTTVQYTPSSAWQNTSLPAGMVFQTVSSVTTTDGRGSSSTTNYSYQGGLWSHSERRFLGFRKVTGVLDAAGNYTETYYHQHVGCVSKPEATYFRDAAGRIYSYSKYTYQENSAPPYTSLLTERWDYECNQGATCQRVVNQLGYDVYGNVVRTLEYGNYDASGDERTTVRGFYPNTTRYIVAKAAYENVYAGIGTAGRLMRQTLHAYDGATTYASAPVYGDLTSRKRWNDQSGGYVTEAFTYDASGNLASRTDERGHTRTTAYDTTFRLYPVRECDALGHCKGTTYDLTLGKVTSETDANGLTHTRGYDALGRLVRETRPDGGWVERQYLSWGSASGQRVRLVQSDGTADGLWVDEYFDGMRRVYKRVRENGATHLVLYSDGSERVWKESLWYDPATETPRYQVFAYDGAGRVRTVTSPDGSFAENVYQICHNPSDPDFAAPRSCITHYDELRHATRKAADGLGNVVAVSEWSGGVESRTRYQRDVLGRLARVTDAAGNVSTKTWDSLGNKLAECDPDLGCWSYGYDAAGNRTSETDARGQTTRVTYDALGRRVSKALPGGGLAAWRYDEAGHGAAVGDRPTSLTWDEGSENLSYDFAGRVTSSTRCILGVCATTRWAYDQLGRLASVTYGDGESVSHAYDSAGRLASVGGYVNALAYNARGQITRVSLANGVTQSYTYDAGRQWLSSSQVLRGTTTLYSANYAYDAAARVTSQSSSTDPLLNVNYGYDERNRLVSVSGAQSQFFTYDALGNLTYNSAVGAYGYGSATPRHASTVAGASSYTYDANGNMTGGAGRELRWDDENRLASVTRSGQTTTFFHDPDGGRISKTTAGNTTRYFGKLFEIGPGGAYLKHVYAGALLVASKGPAGTSFMHQDHLGSVQLMTNATGAVVHSYDYAAYGKTLADSGGVANTRGFGGHETDGETGLVYMNARYFDPELGRFISPDSMVPDLENPQALNRYAFGYNNPISNVDPTGHAPVVAAVVAVVSVAASTAPVWVTAVAAVGAAATVAGYVLKDPFLMTLGGIALGFATGYMGPLLGGGLAGGLMGASVAALTSPLSPLEPGLKQAIGWAYTAASFVAGQMKSSETLEQLEQQAQQQAAREGVDMARVRANFEDPQRALSSAYVAAQETHTSLQHVLETAMRAGEKGFGMVGPGSGMTTTVLEKLVGWIPSVRLHGVVHDAYGFAFNTWQIGPGYTYAGQLLLSQDMPVAGQVTGVFRNSFLTPYGLSDIQNSAMRSGRQLELMVISSTRG